MSEPVMPGNSAPEPKPVESGNVSASAFAAMRLGKRMEAAKAPPPASAAPESAPEPQPPAEATAEEQSLTPAEPQGEDVLSKLKKELATLDLDSLSPEQVADLSSALKSKALARFGELTAKRKSAEEELARIREEREKEPFSDVKVENNPFTNLETIDALEAKYQEVSDLQERLEGVLDNGDGYAADDVIHAENGVEYTKRQIRDLLRNARKARDKFLPAQLREVQTRNERSQIKRMFEEQAKKELPWMDGEDNDTRRAYKAMVDDPRLNMKEVERVAPDFAVQMSWLLAHAANSINGRKQLEPSPAKAAKPALQPPSSPSSSGALSSRPEVRADKALQDLSSRFGQTGSKHDWMARRALQLSKRK